MKIFIENFRFKTIIGILQFEREQEQDVIINLEMDYDYRDGKFINYVDARDLIKHTMISWKFELIEDALLHIVHHLAQEFEVEKVKLKITKPSILEDAEVSVEMEKSFV
jgi:dihydroneopterin aldolase